MLNDVWVIVVGMFGEIFNLFIRLFLLNFFTIFAT